jgi:hypothetical protein
MSTHFSEQHIALIFRVKDKPSKLYLPQDFTLVSCSIFSSAQKMEAVCSSEISVD